MSAPATIPFGSWLRQTVQSGGLGNEDILAVALPLFRFVRGLHEEGLVAPLTAGALHYDPAANALTFERSLATPPRDARRRVEALQAPESRGLEVVGHERREADLDAETVARTDLTVAEAGAEITRPVYLPDYRSWEQAVGHHDALTDLFLLGEVLASLACGLDFTDPADLARFVGSRGNLFQLQERLHPVIAAVIVELTELNRHRRARDLGAVIVRLENYREQPAALDLGRLDASASAAPSGRRQLILSRLRDRLFEISRRNRLVYFKPGQQTVNLTVASVPTLLDHRNVRAEQLCHWHAEFSATVGAGNAVILGKYLRFEDHPYVSPALDKLIGEARRDRAEYGFQQLRLVVAFLRWHNLREAPEELIESPLLLLPVELTKKKGVRDSYVLEPAGTIAEVNPALRFFLAQLYRLALPEEIDLRETSVEQFHAQLRAQIQASEPGVTLRLIDKPQIRLVQERARQRVDAFRRRQALRVRPGAPPGKVSHSYARDDYRPLGLALFRERVLPKPFPMRLAAGGSLGAQLPPAHLIDPEPPAPVVPVIETERDAFTLAVDPASARNPYAWEFDLCAVTLGNFNTRKMSLVHDYASLLEEAPPCPAFDTIFSLSPRPVAREIGPLPLAEQHFVVSSDAAQAAAVARAQAGESFIIQGPPGTGKSQTITNLIADFVARGKRVLFVCEKRAAIDVVFHRLRQQGLDELCCLIHDSQTDKKEFIQNLKQTYENFLTPSESLAAGARARAETVERMEQELDSLRRFAAHMTAAEPSAGVSPHQLLTRLLTLRPEAGELELSAEDEELLPTYALWREHGEVAVRLERALRECGEDPAFARHPLRHLRPAVFEAERPLAELRSRLDRAEAALDSVENALDLAGGPAGWAQRPLGVLGELLDFVAAAAGLAEHGLLGALEPRSEAARAVKKFSKEWASKSQVHAAAAEKSAGWKDPLSPADCAIFLERAQAAENSALRWLSPAWWKLRSEVRRRYDFSRHQLEPPYARVLGDLSATQQAAAALDGLRAEWAAEWRTDDPAALAAEVRGLQERANAGPPELRAGAKELAEREHADSVAGLAAARADFVALRSALEFLELPADLALDGLPKLLREVRTAADVLPELLPALRDLAATAPSFARAVRFLPLTAGALEFASARRALLGSWREDRHAARLDGAQLEARIARFHQLGRGLLGTNAVALRHRVRGVFLEHVRLSGLPAAQLDAGQKVFKKSYATGRRELEHEFGKSMRYRSIRDLSAAETGGVLRDLKPVWLMSPLSVSDTLPLEPDLFDVAIFDEASQVPLEEAIPALYRAPQVIVVGDEMQLPPTSFFGPAREDEEGVAFEEEGERVALALDADSFLTQSAVSLPSTLLAWHYRSRSEALISFSNAAFYGAKLLTIPDRALPPSAREPILVRAATEAEQRADDLLARSISFHRLERSEYVGRRNLGEAEYLAQLVRALLRRETGLSIGIVAFSEAQQGAIEEAIARLADADADFAARYEAETNREEDDQFCGLFIKNLENVQGDERDIILLSICYGRDAGGRMLMNFGPINQRGGEKRLNVIFSRAKRHMAVVSSIRHPDITNDWNDGASALKNFLRYAEHISAGEGEHAAGVLAGLNALQRGSLSEAQESDVACRQLAAALRARGHTVDLATGQSRFRCDLAIRAGNGLEYALAVQLDTVAHYANADLQERYFTRPGLLRAFGWRVLHVLTKDWFENPDRVLERIERALADGGEGAESTTDAAGEGPADGPTIERGERNVAAVAEASAQPVTASAAEPVASAQDDMFRRRLEYDDGVSRKFWEVTVEDDCLQVRFGRLGTAGQTQQKRLPDAASARARAESLAAEKRAKGYRDQV